MSRSGSLGGAARLRQALARFHALADIRRAGSPSPDPALAAAVGIDLPHETTWAAVAAHFEAEAEPDDAPAAIDLLARLPDPAGWLDYLARFPPDADHESYRADRARTALRRLSLLHPDGERLRAFATAPDTLSDAARNAIRRHVGGPLICVPCRRQLQSLRPDRGWFPAARLAARSAEAAFVELPIDARSGRVRCVDDAGYLRVFLHAAGTGAASSARTRLRVIFADGTALQGESDGADGWARGVNLGRLAGRNLDEVTAILLPAAVIMGD